jgi:hypothetical protein
LFNEEVDRLLARLQETKQNVVTREVSIPHPFRKGREMDGAPSTFPASFRGHGSFSSSAAKLTEPPVTFSLRSQVL